MEADSSFSSFSEKLFFNIFDSFQDDEDADVWPEARKLHGTVKGIKESTDTRRPWYDVEFL